METSIFVGLWESDQFEHAEDLINHKNRSNYLCKWQLAPLIVLAAISLFPSPSTFTGPETWVWRLFLDVNTTELNVNLVAICPKRGFCQNKLNKKPLRHQLSWVVTSTSCPFLMNPPSTFVVNLLSCRHGDARSSFWHEQKLVFR